jgi:hypothetical protein
MASGERIGALIGTRSPTECQNLSPLLAMTHSDRKLL